MSTRGDTATAFHPPFVKYLILLQIHVNRGANYMHVLINFLDRELDNMVYFFLAGLVLYTQPENGLANMIVGALLIKAKA